MDDTDDLCDSIGRLGLLFNVLNINNMTTKSDRRCARQWQS